MNMSVGSFQHRFTRSILEGDSGLVSDAIVPAGFPVEERLNIYRNNSFITLGAALAQNFPVLYRLVGQAFFDQLARRYIRVCPPESPVLMTYGAEMANFLCSVPEVKDLPYLSDVARFEHQWNFTFNGPDASGFEIARLNEIAPEKFNDLVFRFLPNMGMLYSVYPILDIWLANQEDSPLGVEINLDQGEAYLAVFRRGLEVEVMRLDEAGYELVKRLAAGETLGQAGTQVMDLYTDFSLEVALQAILQAGLIDGFMIK
tara:strand:- start:9923 stop:10699 length:777 start_codon:yes stop_codon:yes gene_type:complete